MIPSLTRLPVPFRAAAFAAWVAAFVGGSLAWGVSAQDVRPDPAAPGVDTALNVLKGSPASRGSAQDEAPSSKALVGFKVRCQELVNGLVSAGLPGASAAVVLSDGSLHTFVAGKTSGEGGRDLTPVDRMLVGSTGKTFVTAVAHRLMEQGVLSLDTTTAELFGEQAPEWLERLPHARDFTLGNLLRHQTGLERYVFEQAFTQTLSSEVDRVWRPEELLAFVFDRPPLFAPGEGWAYSDTNYIVVGMMIERVTGRRFYELAQEMFVVPLGLKDTLPTDSARVPGLVQGQVINGRGMGIGTQLLDEQGKATYNLQFEWCGGGWASTPGDLARWAGALYGGTALKSSSLRTLLDTVEAPGLWPGTRYGLGVMLRETDAGPMRFHDGFMPGHLTTLAHFPRSGVSAALQVNTDDARAIGRQRFEVLVELAGLAESLAN